MVPKVSIVTTIYNRDRYLAQAIESVLAQTYPDFELILWDDGSTDESQAIAQHYAKQDPRIRVFSAPNQGYTRALQAAHAVVRGEYVGWVDSDDAIAPDALAETVAVLDKFLSVGLVYTNYAVMNELGQVTGPGVRCAIPYSRDRLLIDFMTFHFRLLRRSCYEQVGGVDPFFKYAQDYDLCLRLSEVTDVFKVMRSLYCYRTHPASISKDKYWDQASFAKEAIARAMQRRGLDQDYELDMQVENNQSRFRLKPKVNA